MLWSDSMLVTHCIYSRGKDPIPTFLMGLHNKEIPFPPPWDDLWARCSVWPPIHLKTSVERQPFLKLAVDAAESEEGH